MRAEDDDTLGDEAFAALVVGRLGSGNRVSPAEACPDANLLAAARGGRLLPEERESLEDHLRRCGSCRGVFAAIVRAGDAELLENGRTIHAQARPWPRPVRRHWAWAAAAAVLITAPLAWTLARWLARQPDAGPARTEDLLLASAQDLATVHPDLFADFRPLDADELAARAPLLRAPVERDARAALTLLEPAGRILDTRP
ncbi:MAG TPA: hypothetical protein VMS76_04530, partial [Planctomycetota bacterium]|nr:hypothetical protein [Planctomycetota bacterium]